MSLLRRLFERRDLYGSNLDPNRIPRNSEGYGTASGVGVSAKSATRLSAVYSAVRLLSQTVASLPIDAYRKAGKTRVEMTLPRWLERPNPDFNRFEFLEQIMCSLLLHGNAYAVKIPDGEGGIGELWVAHPEHVRIEGKPGQRTYKLSGNGTTEEFTSDEIVHIRGTSRPGSVYGMSPIDEARSSLGLALAAEEFGGAFFRNNSTAGGVIQIPGEPDKSILKRMALEWKASHQGLANAHEPGFLTGGATWQSITIPNDAAQFIETRKFQTSEIARWFGVPAHMIGDLEHATFSNIEHQAIEFVVHGVRPWLVRIEHALNPLLGRGAAPDRRTSAFIKFNVEGLLRGDAKARAEFYSTMRNIGALNADEIRALEDLAPIPDGLGKIYWQPGNMLPAGTSPPEPKPPAVEPAPAMNGNGTSDRSRSAERVARLLAAADRH